SLPGYVALAGPALREPHLRKPLDLSRTIDLPLSPTACARHFGMDESKWAIVHERTSVHYRRVAGYRYDPTERLEKSRHYAEAARLGTSSPFQDSGPRVPGEAPDAKVF